MKQLPKPSAAPNPPFERTLFVAGQRSSTYWTNCHQVPNKGGDNMTNDRDQDSRIENILADNPNNPIPQEVVAAMTDHLQALRERLGSAGTTRAPRGWWTSRWSAPAFSAAAVLVLVGMIFWMAQSGKGSNLAFAAVLEEIRNFRPYAYTMTIKSEDGTEQSERLHYLTLSRRREEMAGGSVRIFDMTTSPVLILTLVPDEKLAIEERLTGFGPAQDPDWLQLLNDIQNGQENRLGHREVDGRSAVGFRVHQPEADWEVWADPRTRLPVQIELKQPQLRRTLLMTDFDFEERLDEAMFATTAPEGYAVQRIENSDRNPVEKDLIEGLRAVAELLGGEFPACFDEQSLRDLLRQRREASADKGIKEVAEKTRLALRYVELLKEFEKVPELAYVGGGVRLGDATKPVIWWRLNAQTQCRVVYGDLSIRDVAPEELPAQARAAAQVTPQVEAFKPYSCIQTVAMDSGTSTSQKIKRLSLSRRREENIGDSGVTIIDMSKQPVRILELRPEQKTAVETILTNKGPMQDPDLMQIVRSLENGERQDLGQRTFGNRQAHGFHAALPGNDFTVWMDEETDLPILIELVHPGQGRKLIYSDFKYDQQFDEGLFSTAAPEGYSVERQTK